MEYSTPSNIGGVMDTLFSTELTSVWATSMMAENGCMHVKFVTVIWRRMNTSRNTIFSDRIPRYFILVESTDNEESKHDEPWIAHADDVRRFSTQGPHILCHGPWLAQHKS